MVILYTKTRCIQCDMTKRWLDNHDIQYKQYNVDTDYEALLYITGMGFKSVPVVFWEKNSWAGFQPDKLEEMLNGTRDTQEDYCSCGVESVSCTGCR